jgi:EAL domain-containing protein (putative c-di-GMP-specific phosphodiesterase class I)
MLSSTTTTAPRFVLRSQRGASSDRHGAAGDYRRFPRLPRTPGAGFDSAAEHSEAARRSRLWLARLRRALREELFELHYQPIVELRGGAVTHYEALLRLADEPAGKLLAPGVFLPVAERHGLVRELDRMVLAKVAALLGNDADARGLAGACVAVNLSALSVTDAGMLTHIERLLARHRVDPARLVVEITETAAISDMGRASAFCEGVQALGCAVALDDFGVGFGSLYYAKRLPFHYLKIDGDFVRDLCASANDRVVVRAIVDLARGLGRQTIAEFVGDEPTMRLLRELGVDYAQGFQIGRPQPLSSA